MLTARAAGCHLSRKLDQESRNGCTPEPATSVTVSSHPLWTSKLPIQRVRGPRERGLAAFNIQNESFFRENMAFSLRRHLRMESHLMEPRSFALLNAWELTNISSSSFHQTMWIERTTYTTAYTFPGILKWFEVRQISTVSH